MLDGQVIGSTSPATLTMGAPGLQALDRIMVQQGRPLFGTPMHLWERDEEFVMYLVHWFNAFPQARRHMSGLYSYILTNLEVARRRRPELYRKILGRVENPTAFNREAAEALATSLADTYAEPATSNPPRLYGAPLLTRRAADLLLSPSESDFLLCPAIEQPAGQLLPLILREGFTPAGAEQFRYISGPWLASTRVSTGGIAPEKRVLPDTSIVYPWLTSCDFLEDVIIELSTPIAPQFYSPERGTATEPGYLLPVKSLFFKYFPASYLAGNVVPGRRAIEMRREGDAMTVILRLPTKKSYVELSRTYRRQQGPDTGAPIEESEGLIIENSRLSAAVFPFARTGMQDIYNVRLFEMMPDFKASLSFYASGVPEPLSVKEPFVRTSTRVARTSYYEVNHSWDYARVTIASGRAGGRLYQAVILPLWPSYSPSADQFTFAVDFGTTNTHVEYAIGDTPARPLTFDRSAEATLVATLESPGSLAQADTLLDVEFIPRALGDDYGFPLRTALARNVSTDARPEALRSVNIPFLYERKPFNGYRVSTMLKWGDEQADSEQFLREIMLLIRARIILDSGSPSRTRIVYFYPVSMKRSLQHRYLSLWEDLCARYLDPAHIEVQGLPESVAPAYFYHNASTDGSDYASIDIGGGSSDVVIYRADEQKMQSYPDIIASFRLPAMPFSVMPSLTPMRPPTLW